MPSIIYTERESFSIKVFNTRMIMTNNAITDYYDACEIDYKLFWDLKKSCAMHAGYWDESTKTLREALERENQILAEMAGIKANDKVLDSGCGIGGSSMFLAKKIGCETVGITLSAKQVETATRIALERNLSSKCTFMQMDFTDLQFKNNTFDVVWGIESYCHAKNKQLAVREAFRVLKPGGTLIIADGFQLQKRLMLKEMEQMKKWLQGWGCEALDSSDEFNSHLYQAGFTDINFKDITEHVMPSSRRLYYISFPAIVFSKVCECLRLRSRIQTNNIIAAYAQYKTLQKKLWHYGIFTAVK